MQQPQKLLSVIYCAALLRPALLMDGSMYYFITHFLKNICKNQKPLKNTRALLIECHYQLNLKEKIIQQRKIFYEIIVSKLREKHCN